MFHAPSNPFPSAAGPSPEEQQQIARGREEAQTAASHLSRLLARDNTEFAWFMETCIVAEAVKEQATALDPNTKGKQRKIAVQRLALLNEILQWPERTLAEKAEFLRTTATVGADEKES